MALPQPTTSYNPQNVIISMGGVLLTGFAEGDAINLVPNADRYTTVVGSDGLVTRVKSLNQSWVATIRLLQSSPSNAVLTGFAELDDVPQFGAGVLPFSMTDLNGTTLVTAAQAWVSRWPDVAFGSELNEYEWQITLGSAQVVVAGIDVVGLI